MDARRSKRWYSSGGRRMLSVRQTAYPSEPDYSAGADGWVGAGVAWGAGSVVVAGGLAGASAGGVVLCVVVLSVPLSLQAATLSRASAENEARTILFMIFLSFTIDTRGQGSRMRNAIALERLRHLR